MNLILPISFFLYVVFFWLIKILSWKSEFIGSRSTVFIALLNIGICGYIYSYYKAPGYIHGALYVLFVISSFYLTNPSLLQRKSRLHWIPLFFPVIVLVLFKSFHWTYFAGISYLSFRLSYLVMEVRDGLVERPSLSSYLSYAFFPPLMAIGPISSYRLFAHSLHEPDWKATPIGDSVQRILLGIVKFLFVSQLLRPIIPSELLQDGYYHGSFDLIFSTVAYYFYIYCNFSGYTDIVIGVSGLMGIRVQENFHNPYFARNMQDFWHRWHVTLANFMRDIVFAPYLKFVSKKFGRKNYTHFVAIGILITFALTGVWHGFTINFLIYGLVHATGLIIHYYYTLWLRKFLGAKISWYNSSLVIRTISTTITFFYLAFSFHFFAYDWVTLKKVFSVIVF